MRPQAYSSGQLECSPSRPVRGATPQEVRGFTGNKSAPPHRGRCDGAVTLLRGPEGGKQRHADLTAPQVGAFLTR